MKVSLLVKIDQQKQLDKSQDLSCVFFPVGLLEKYIDHYYNELSDIDWALIKIEAFLDLC